MSYPNFTIYWKEIPSVRVERNAAGEPTFQRLSAQYVPVYLYGMDGNGVPTCEKLDKFFADRCFPSTRQNARELLSSMGLSVYQPKQICRKTHGVVAHDHFWIRYDDDPDGLSYDTLRESMKAAVRYIEPRGARAEPAKNSE